MMNGAWVSDVNLLPYYDHVKHQPPYNRLRQVLGGYSFFPVSLSDH